MQDKPKKHTHITGRKSTILSICRRLPLKQIAFWFEILCLAVFWVGAHRRNTAMLLFEQHTNFTEKLIGLRANGKELALRLRFLSLRQQVLKPNHPLFSSRLPIDLLFIGMSLKAVCADLKQFCQPTSICQNQSSKRCTKKTGMVETCWIKKNSSCALKCVGKPLSKTSRWGKESRAFTVEPIRCSKYLCIGKTTKLFFGKIP